MTSSAAGAGTAAASPPLDVERHGQGPPLVLLHGFGASRFTFRHWVEPLARTHTVYLVDLFGFGAAPPPPDGRYGPVEQADAVVRWLRREELRGVVLIGHSLGGGVALLVALRLAELGESDRLRALVSIAGPAYPQAIPRYIGLARVPLLGRLLFGLAGPERIVRKVLGRGHPDIDDVTQDAVIALLTALLTFRGECSVEHFANRIALLTALAARRRSRSRRWRA